MRWGSREREREREREIECAATKLTTAKRETLFCFFFFSFGATPFVSRLDSSPVHPCLFEHASRSAIAPIERALSWPRPRAGKRAESERKTPQKSNGWGWRMRVLIFVRSSLLLLTSSTTTKPCSSSARASRPWPRWSSARGRRRAPCRERRARLERRASWPWFRYKRG